MRVQESPLKFVSRAQAPDHRFRACLAAQKDSMDAQMILAARCLRVGLLSIVTAVPYLIGASTVQATLSEMLSQQILEAQKAEAERHFGKAIDIYGRAMGQGIAVVEEHLRLLLKKRALDFERTNQLAKAEADLTAALNVKPIDPTLYADRGYFYLRQNQYERALADFASGSRADPKNPLYRFAAGRVHAAMADFQGAIQCYNDALKIDKNYGVAILSRAEAYVHLEKLQEAKADYDRAIGFRYKWGGDRFFAFLGRGYINILLEDFEDAVRDLDEALATEPSDLNALLYRGYAYERRGNAELALRDYERAFLSSPENLWVRTSLQRLRSNAEQ
jgi:tetratricopeptide (TPR) repeat protein